MRKTALFFLVLGLGGCFKVGPDYQKPELISPPSWRFSSNQQAQDLSNSLWWQQLGDPVLNHLVDQALENNLDLKIAIANMDKFVGFYGTTRSHLFPQVSGAAEYARQQTSREQLRLNGVGLGGRDSDYAQLGAQMNWELDVWGALRRANEAAFADLLAQQAVQRGVLLSLVSNVVQSYVQLRTLDRDLEIAQNVVESLKEDLRIRRIRYKEGYTSDLEVNQAESEYERRAALIPTYQQSIAQTEHALCLLLSQPPGPIERGLALDQLKLPEIPAGLPSDVLIRRPDIDQAEQALVAATARIGVAKGQYFPKIALTGNAGQISTQMASLFTPGANFWTIGSTLATPLITAGKIAGQVQAAEAEQQAAMANYQQTVLNAFREFENALVSREKTQIQREKQSRRVDSVAHYYRLSQIRYDEGYTDYITVLDAVRQLFDAQIDLISAQNTSLVASIDIYRSMGGGWISLATGEWVKTPHEQVFPQLP